MSPCGRPVTDCADVLRRSDVVLSGLHRTGLVWSGVVLSGVLRQICAGPVSSCLVWSGPMLTASDCAPMLTASDCAPVRCRPVWSARRSGLLWSGLVRCRPVCLSCLVRCPVSCASQICSGVRCSPVRCPAPMSSCLLWSDLVRCPVCSGLHRTALLWSGLVCIGQDCSGLVRCPAPVSGVLLWSGLVRCRRAVLSGVLLWSGLVRCPVVLSARRTALHRTGLVCARSAPDCAPVSSCAVCLVWSGPVSSCLVCSGLHRTGLLRCPVVLSGPVSSCTAPDRSAPDCAPDWSALVCSGPVSGPVSDVAEQSCLARRTALLRCPMSSCLSVLSGAPMSSCLDCTASDCAPVQICLVWSVCLRVGLDCIGPDCAPM